MLIITDSNFDSDPWCLIMNNRDINTYTDLDSSFVSDTESDTNYYSLSITETDSDPESDSDGELY